MNIENCEKWVNALNSGNYKQGINSLKIDDGSGPSSFCCLGVACDISGLGEWSYDEYHIGDEYDFVTLQGDISKNDAVGQWLGLDDTFIADLISLNDNGASFEIIAALIKSRIDRERTANGV